MTNKKRKTRELATLTEAELFGKDFMEWKRDVTAACDQLNAMFKKRFGMTLDEAWKRMQDGKRKRQTPRKELSE